MHERSKLCSAFLHLQGRYRGENGKNCKFYDLKLQKIGNGFHFVLYLCGKIAIMLNVYLFL